MKKIFIVFSIAYFFLLNFAYAQKALLTFDSTPYVCSENNNFELTNCPRLPEDEDFSYKRVLSGMNYTDITVEKVSKKTGKVIWRKKLPFAAYQFSKGYYLNDIEQIGTDYIVFIRKDKPKTKGCYLSAQKMDNEMVLKGEEKELAPNPVSGNVIKSFYFYKVNRIENHFLILGNSISSSSFVSSKNCQQYLSVLDTNLNLIWEKTIDLPKDMFYKLDTITLDQQLNITAVFKISPKLNVLTGEKSIATRDCEYLILTYDHVSDSVKSKNISLADERFGFHGKEVSVIDLSKNRADIYFQYNKFKANAGYEGICHVGVDLSSMEAGPLQLIPFPANLKNARTEGVKPINDVYYKNLTIRNIYYTDAKKTIFVLEEYKLKTNTFTTIDPLSSSYMGSTQAGSINRQAGMGQRNKQSTLSNYSYDNIYIIQTDNNGTAEWSQSIAKESSGPQAAYLGMYSFYDQHTLYILFNSTLKSALKDGEKYEFGSIFKNSNTLVLLSLNQAGKITSKELLNAKENEDMICNIKSIKSQGAHQTTLMFDDQVNRLKLGGNYSTIRASLQIRP